MHTESGVQGLQAAERVLCMELCFFFFTVLFSWPSGLASPSRTPGALTGLQTVFRAPASAVGSKVSNLLGVCLLGTQGAASVALQDDACTRLHVIAKKPWASATDPTLGTLDT